VAAVLVSVLSCSIYPALATADNESRGGLVSTESGEWTSSTGAPKARELNSRKTVISSGGLRWRTPDRYAARRKDSMRKAVHTTTSVAVPQQGNGRSTVVKSVGATDTKSATARSGVTRALHQQPVTPFDDPFNDRLAQNDEKSAAPKLAEPAQLAPNEVFEPAGPQEAGVGNGDNDDNATPRRLGADEPGAAEPESGESSLPTPKSPEPAPFADGLVPLKPKPAETELPKEKPAPCKQTYKERNYCDEQTECANTWKQLSKNPIRNILLDITPSYKPEEADPAKVAEECQKDLAPNASRKWSNVNGYVLGVLRGKAYGLDGEDWETPYKTDPILRREADKPRHLEARMLRHDDETVEVRTEDGETFSFRFEQLSREDKYFVLGREWRTRDNKLRTVGRLIAYRDGDVHIATDDGSTVKIPFRTLGDDELAWVTAYWLIPSECTLPKEEAPIRDFTMLTFTWKASGLCHKPLYFEQRALERYGHSTGPISQPILSSAHFFASTAVLPYKMGMNPPNECMYALGYYRPGSCAPYLVPPIPLSLRGAIFQAGAVVGVVNLIP